MKILNKTLLFIIIAGFVFMFAGCGSPKTEKVNIEEVKVYANPAADKIISGMNEENYPKFSEDFDPKMKEALNETKFKEIVNQLGKCEFKEIIGADKVQGYTRAYYKAKFPKFPSDITLTIVFSNTGDNKVSGLFYK